MTSLPTDLRKRLEKAIVEARTAAEQGARKALEALAVGRHEPHGSMSTRDRALRNRLRAHGRQLGDERDAKKGTQSIRRLEREVAYEHWHRMLFARFLAENGLLIEPTTAVDLTLEECEELARERGLETWALAASFAQGMLPRIFRADDPVLAVTLPPETGQTLGKLVADLPAAVFMADDSLGWTYQFWQKAEKEAVNARGEKITGETLPAVTQLFTEPYMVQFLLHNTLGAWHAGKVLAARPELGKSAASEAQLHDAVALDGYRFEYLRFVRTPLSGEDPNAGTGPWRPAAGTYSGWPRNASEITLLDPCCGSGHFLVAAFDLLVRLRQAEDGLGTEEAVRAVLAENLFGLELDGRCTQIAAFNLALAAWRCAGGPIELPPLQIACSGIGPNASKEEWLALAEEAAARGGMPAKRDLLGREESLLSGSLRAGLEQLYETFQLAPELGSLIDPGAQASDLYVAGFERLGPLLDAMLEAESTGDELHERAVAAQGMARAARILAAPGGYTLVITNVPYLLAGKMSLELKQHCESNFPSAKNDLAYCMVMRFLFGSGVARTCAFVTPNSFLHMSGYREYRELLLTRCTFSLLARLGPRAFETISGEVVRVALSCISGGASEDDHVYAELMAERESTPTQKAAHLRSGPVGLTVQQEQVSNPEHRFVLGGPTGKQLLGSVAKSYIGLQTSDNPRFALQIWEVPETNATWRYFQTPAPSIHPHAGRDGILRWNAGAGDLHVVGQIKGTSAWGKQGIAVRLMGELPATLYDGDVFEQSSAVLVPDSPSDIVSLWCYCTSSEFLPAVQAVDQAIKITNKTFEKIPFDIQHWRKVAAKTYPNGLPEPQSDDPTQWLFHGHPAHAEAHAALQAAIARLVGYRWPSELDDEMRLGDEARALVRRCAELLDHADEDGVVCLGPIQGEGSAADRLRALLAAAFGPEWSAAKEQDLLRAAGERFARGKVQGSLEDWLRDRFFEEHCALFHNRPFVWHVWDGLPGGFHALVHYHRLAGPDGEGRRTLEKLASTYLGEWIDRQRQLSAAGEEGADGRLAAALDLQAELRKILEGAPPYDIFVRWKPLHEQPLGWDPDIDDGVRLNIRPFLKAKDVGKKHAGILRVKPDNTWSNAKKPGVKDRGKEPESLRPRHLFPWFWGCDPEQHREHRLDFGAGTEGSSPAGKAFTGARWNGLHYTRAAKEAARRAAAERAAEESGS